MRPWILTASLACALLTSACAQRGPRLAAVSPPATDALPQVETPAEARQPCEIYRLPARATQADLETGFNLRGLQILECDIKRELAVKAADLEHQLEARALVDRERRRRAWWKWW